MRSALKSFEKSANASPVPQQGSAMRVCLGAENQVAKVAAIETGVG
jgi:hypothetical protein